MHCSECPLDQIVWNQVMVNRLVHLYNYHHNPKAYYNYLYRQEEKNSKSLEVYLTHPIGVMTGVVLGGVISLAQEHRRFK